MYVCLDSERMRLSIWFSVSKLVSLQEFDDVFIKSLKRKTPLGILDFFFLLRIDLVDSKQTKVCSNLL